MGMTTTPTTLARFGMDTASLAGTLQGKLSAIRDAGFAQAMIWASDLVSHPDGLDAAVDIVRSSGLRVTGLQLLRDFEGTYGTLRQHKFDAAASLLDLCRAVAAPMLLVSSSVSPHASGEHAVIARDLAALAQLAERDGVQIGYEALSWGRHVSDYLEAWDIVLRAERPNLGIVLDSHHLLAKGASFDALDGIPGDRIALVQLSDFMWPSLASADANIDTARHARVFPGEGEHTAAIKDLVRRLERIGYRGDISFEVLNDDFLQMPRARVAARAWKAAHSCCE
jgi:sugar phosphate isomerase/epimerase